MKIGDQVFRAVLDTGATLSIVARRLLKTFRKTKTVAIRVGDGRTIHSLGGVDVTICLGHLSLCHRRSGVTCLCDLRPCLAGHKKNAAAPITLPPHL